MVQAGTALCVPGNHDIKLVKALRGRKVSVTHGLDRSLEQLGAESPEFRQEVTDFTEDWSAITCWTTGRWWWRTPG